MQMLNKICWIMSTESLLTAKRLSEDLNTSVKGKERKGKAQRKNQPAFTYCECVFRQSLYLTSVLIM